MSKIELNKVYVKFADRHFNVQATFNFFLYNYLQKNYKFNHLKHEHCEPTKNEQYLQEKYSNHEIQVDATLDLPDREKSSTA